MSQFTVVRDGVHIRIEADAVSFEGGFVAFYETDDSITFDEMKSSNLVRAFKDWEEIRGPADD